MHQVCSISQANPIRHMAYGPSGVGMLAACTCNVSPLGARALIDDYIGTPVRGQAASACQPIRPVICIRVILLNNHTRRARAEMPNASKVQSPWHFSSSVRSRAGRVKYPHMINGPAGPGKGEKEISDMAFASAPRRKSMRLE